MTAVPQGSPTLYVILTADLPTSDFSFHFNPVIVSSELNCHLKHLEIWYNNWKITINELKSKYVTFTLKKGDCPPVFLNNLKLFHERRQLILGFI